MLTFSVAIDTFGRRNLLLTTFPLMSLCCECLPPVSVGCTVRQLDDGHTHNCDVVFFTGFSFWIPEDSTARIACIALGIYLFGIVYSPGEGPVPFTYSAEAYPLYIRPIGMSLATATTWFFNFILSVTWPSLLRAFKPQGAFGWYAAWNIVGFFLVSTASFFTIFYGRQVSSLLSDRKLAADNGTPPPHQVLFFLPETKEKTLEELDSVFNVPLRVHARYGLEQFFYFFRRYVFWRNVDPPRVPHDESLQHSEKAIAQKAEYNPTARV